MIRGNLDRERRVALQAVREAARVCRAVREEFSPSDAATKSDRSPVTVADFASQAIVSTALAEAFPGVRIMAEESRAGLATAEATGIAERVVRHVRAVRPGADLAQVYQALDRGGDAGAAEGRYWALDPVDGTKGFLRNEQYAVALALIEDGRVVLGALASPNLGGGGLFVAQQGGGAWELPLDGGDEQGRPVHVRALTNPSGARYTESVEAGHSSQGATAAIAEALGISQPPLRMDSQTKYAAVARGDADLYLRLPSAGYVENVWDHAAGSLIVDEAGGRVTDFHGAPLDFRTGRRLERNRGVVAAAAGIHAAAVAAADRLLATV